MLDRIAVVRNLSLALVGAVFLMAAACERARPVPETTEETASPAEATPEAAEMIEPVVEITQAPDRDPVRLTGAEQVRISRNFAQGTGEGIARRPIRVGLDSPRALSGRADRLGNRRLFQFRRTLLQHQPELSQCYASYLPDEADREAGPGQPVEMARVEMALRIEGGAVVNAEVAHDELGDEAVTTCLTERLRQLSISSGPDTFELTHTFRVPRTAD